jgi:hypothetical protein
MSFKGSNFIWGGRQEFWISGTSRDEDLLRIESNYSGVEDPLKLTLPTLCITYADMNFNNAIGGCQENYPSSIKYGPLYFDPPVEIVGRKEIEKLTWIRGAHRVVIGPDRTEIYWYMWESLIIPRLRIDNKKSAKVLLTIPDTPITVDEELIIKVRQYADARRIGGLRIEKRHPNWKPKKVPKEYDLWIRVINGETMNPMTELELKLFRWNPSIATPYGFGGLELIEKRYTGSSGSIQDSNRPSDELEAVTINLPGWRAIPRCFRPLPGQHVRFQMFAWQLKNRDFIPYTWKINDSIGQIALLTGFTPEYILKSNGLLDATNLKAGISISLPCYAATYTIEYGNSIEWLAKAFSYPSIEELAKYNGLVDPSKSKGLSEIFLPGWHFLYARQGDSLENIDSIFNLPSGSSRTVDRIHHPDSRLPFESETIAIPTDLFVKNYINK